jgi:AraC-like DNA-binding protein/mannose-6-phosphate isomerase-like protein (cupin superfamily)
MEGVAAMRAEGDVTWERVDSFVDRRIDAKHFHVWPFGHPCPADVRFLILDRRRDVPMHRPDHLEVVVFESGERGYEVEDRTCMLRKNDIIVVGDHIWHRCLSLGVSQCEARAVVLSFMPKLVDSGVPLGDDVQYLMPFKLLDASFPNVIPAGTGLSRGIFDFIERIRRELPGDSERSRLAIKTYLKMILLTLVNHYSELSATRRALLSQQSNVRRLAPVFEHIEQHYEESIRVKDAARRCAMSDCCFMHFFKEVTGQSFVAYLNRFRVARAQHLLASTDKAIADISLEIGFCNQSYFGVMFRRITGMTPLEYRRKTAELVFEGAKLTPSGLPISPPPLPHHVPSTSGSFNTDVG